MAERYAVASALSDDSGRPLWLQRHLLAFASRGTTVWVSGARFGFPALFHGSDRCRGGHGGFLLLAASRFGKVPRRLGQVALCSISSTAAPAGLPSRRYCLNSFLMRSPNSAITTVWSMANLTWYAMLALKLVFVGGLRRCRPLCSRRAVRSGLSFLGRCSPSYPRLAICCR